MDGIQTTHPGSATAISPVFIQHRFQIPVPLHRPVHFPKPDHAAVHQQQQRRNTADQRHGRSRHTPQPFMLFYPEASALFQSPNRRITAYQNKKCSRCNIITDQHIRDHRAFARLIASIVISQARHLLQKPSGLTDARKHHAQFQKTIQPPVALQW